MIKPNQLDERGNVILQLGSLLDKDLFKQSECIEHIPKAIHLKYGAQESEASTCEMD